MHIALPSDVMASLQKAATSLQKDPSDLVVEAVRAYLEDLDDATEAEKAYEAYVRSGKKTKSFEHVMLENGLSPDEAHPISTD